MGLAVTRRGVLPEIYEAADRRVLGMPGPVWTMALWFAASSIVVGFSLVFPTPPNEDPELRLAAMIYGFAVAIALIFMRSRTPMTFIYMQLVIYILVLIRITTMAGTPQSAVTSGMNLIVLAVYLGWWVPRLASIILIVLANLGLLFSFWRTDRLPDLLVSWLSITALSTGLVIAFGALVWNMKVQLVTDPLTGLLNRQGLGALIDRRTQVVGQQVPRALIALDLDNFKTINDRDGHLAGDRTLAEFGAALSAELRPQDIAFRVGGDEFVVILPNTTTKDADAVAQRLRQAIDIAWSYGVTEWLPDEDFSTASSRADLAMYTDKAERRGDSPKQ
ncbi:MAG: GGDEF domain-containing protein [Actinomycetota bacterium]|nr:GGDEF domain-containing protein [Actinomycetota bacterium]MDP2287634.1 GGDEF domain-containing protein [Actinomycetota bacterium]